jgi:carbon monoxide dehydrogenase subunit G
VARNEIDVAAPPATVWAVLADPNCYGDWVVGSRRIRGWDPDWPAPGASLHHTVGLGPLELKDSTSVRAAARPRLLELRARGRPFGSAEVTLRLTPQGPGTRVTIVENPAGWAAPLRLLPPVHAITRLRNARSLERLRALAERRVGGRRTGA